MNSPILKLSASRLHDGRSFLRENVLVVDAAGKVLDMISPEDAGEEVKIIDGILCPGLVNAHCHLELSHLKGLVPERTGLVNFLIAVIKNRNDTPAEVILEAARAAEEDMRRNGIVAVGDIANKTDSLPVKEAGRLYYHTFVEVLGFSAPQAEKSIQYAEETQQAFRQKDLVASLVPHAPYSVSQALFGLIDDREPSGTICIHNQENPEEDRLYAGGDSEFDRLYDTLHIDHTGFQPSGKSSLQSWLPYFTHGQTLMPVHNAYTTEQDILFALASPHRIFWCLCPNANAYIENRMPPVDLLLRHGADIVLGTDSLASNHQLSILEEMKTLQSHFPHLLLESMLVWATGNGAEALGCGDRFGTFELGKTPGLVQLSPIREKNGLPILSPDTRAKPVNLSQLC